jgi:L-asparaginase
MEKPMQKRIALLATGGTIASTQGKNGYAPTLGAAELIRGIRFPCIIEPRDVFCLDSSNMQPEEWCVLAQATHDALLDCDGVVITHGTDTMAYSASILSFMLAGVEKPVVLTGSQMPIGDALSDARGNLRRAVAAALQEIRGVYVCFDQKLIQGTRCVKTHTTAIDAFSSINAPLAGYFDAEGIHIENPQPFTPSDVLPPGYRLRNTLNANVFLMKLVPGTSPEVFRFIREAGYQGLVIEAFGLGGLHYIRRNLVEALYAFAESDVHVMVVSQCLYEKADLTVYEVGRGLMHQHVHSGRDMTTEAAVTKLMWALAQDNPSALLNASIVGEMKER